VTRYEDLLIYAEKNGAVVIEIDICTNKKYGKTIDNIIYINNQMTECEKYEVLSEEIGHYKTTFGNITNLADIRNLKQEMKARDASIGEVCSINKIIKCIKNGANDRYEIAEMLCVTDELFSKAIEYHTRKNPIVFKDNIMLYFDEIRLVII
jgi:hypothetical protein